ncbi:MAG: PQQ-binding-like beta-propeller repeat protein [Gemmatimonadaceae bacterium]
MTKRALLVVVVSLAACGGNVTDNGTHVDPGPPNPQGVSVSTQHNDNTRAGLNDHEELLTTSNVNAQHFGKLFSLAVDDQVYAQPLVAGKLDIGGAAHNVVYVATVSNSLYAYDGDDGKLYWQRNFTAAGMRAPRNTDMTGACGGGYTDFSGSMGIVGTPVIDPERKTIYFVARSTTGTKFVQYLHAVDLASGNEIGGGPVEITATYPGNGDGSANNVIAFNPQRQNQRQGLTLVNGIVYVTFSSHCDWGPYHGWVLGYDEATLAQRVVYNASPNGYAAGMWESGTGPAADADGNLYVVTGNGSVGVTGDPTNALNRGESALKLTPSGSTLHVASYFTPHDFQYLNDYDLDYGGMGAFLIPNSSYYLTGAKNGNLYLLNKDAMGGYQAASDQVQQVVALGVNANMHCQPAFYHGAARDLVYVWSENDPLRSIAFDRTSNLLDRNFETFFSNGGPTGQNGAVLSVSSNGTVAGTGILWASHAFTGDAEHDVSPGILRAFDANDITRELWNNRQNVSRDGAGSYAKFASPTIANGKVYLPTFSLQVVVYGVL